MPPAIAATTTRTTRIFRSVRIALTSINRCTVHGCRVLGAGAGCLVPVLVLVLSAISAHAQAQQGTTDAPPTRADILRGEYGRYRANNDLLYYTLDVRVDPVRKTIAGTNTIRFRMLADDTRIQLDLHPALNVDRILLGATAL